MIRKEVFYCSESKNFIETIFDYRQTKLEIFFTGTPVDKKILTLDSEHLVVATKSYLKSSNFKCLCDSNCLDLGELELILIEKSYISSIVLLSKKIFSKKLLRREQVYFPNYNDLIFWKILSNRNLNFSVLS